VSDSDRRTFLRQIGAASGTVVLLPTIVSCGAATSDGEGTTPTTGGSEPEAGEGAAGEPAMRPPSDIREPSDASPAPPLVRPDDWDPIAFNHMRGNAGAIPVSYLDDVNGPDGENDHLGKHLPYVPEGLAEGAVPDGMIALMWGNPALGHTRHPNAPPSEANRFEGHWYQWIRIRRAVADEAEEAVSLYTGWPESASDDSGRYAVLDGGDIMADGGRNTIYLATLPPDTNPGDVLRIYGYCLTHGEYVDFLEI
jgi:hypothetical protein